jgi:hypothetical protein
LPLDFCIRLSSIQIDVKTRLAIWEVGARQELDVESDCFCFAVLVGSLNVKAISLSNVVGWSKRCLSQRHIEIVVLLL